MSQTNIIRVPDADQLFLYLAARRRKFTAQAVQFCQERLALGTPASVTAVKERFLREQDVAALYRQMQNHFFFCKECQGYVESQETITACPQCQAPVAPSATAACTVAQAVEEDDREIRFLAEVKKQSLFDDKQWSFLLREQRRLARMGYAIPLSTIICHQLQPQQITALYQALGDEARMATVQQVAAVDMTVPVIRKLQPAKSSKKGKRASSESQLIEDLGSAVSSLRQGRKKVKAVARKKACKPADEMELEPEDEEEIGSLYEALTGNKESQQAQMEGNGMQVDEVSMAKMWQESMQALSKIVASKQAEGENEGEDAEVRQLKRGKRQVKEAEISKIMQEGGELDNVYISELKLSGVEVPFKVSFTNCVFDNVDFSDVKFQHNIEFDGSTFIGKALFRGSTFDKHAMFKNVVFADGADFAKVKFAGETHFNSANFKRFVTFNHSEFQDKTVFTRAYFAKGVKFADVTFAQGASFNDIGCDHRFYMEKCTFQEETTFSNSRFAEVSDFSRSKFAKSVKFKGANFAKWVSFNGAEFGEEANFSGMTADADVSFERANFSGVIQLRTLCAERNLNFLGAHIGTNATFCVLDAYFGRLFITREQIAGHLESHIQKDYATAQKEYGLLKNNFRGINEYEQEDWAYLMEKRMERLSIRVKGVGSALRRFTNWLALDVACGYGTRPFNIFASSMAVLFAFAIFYFVFGSSQFEAKGALSFWDFILVSFRTFANASVGGAEPISNSWINYVMMMESFLGLFVITILAVTFSRKVIR